LRTQMGKSIFQGKGKKLGESGGEVLLSPGTAKPEKLVERGVARAFPSEGKPETKAFQKTSDQKKGGGHPQKTGGEKRRPRRPQSKPGVETDPKKGA